MNNVRRAQISTLVSSLEGLLADAESIKNDEQDYYDAMPESFQGGEKGETAQAAIDEMDQVVESIQSAIDSLGNVE